MTDLTFRDPEIAGVRQLLASMAPPEGAPPPTLAERRAAMDSWSHLSPPPPGCRSEPVDAGGVPGVLHTPAEAEAGRAILFLHGGGYVVGSSTSHGGLAGRMADAAKAATLAIDYRLAPEHPFPAAIDDAVAAYRWLLDQGYAPGKLAIMGDSAGGGLTVATALALKRDGLPQPGALVPISPWVDLAQTGESYAALASVDPMLTLEGLNEMAVHYLGDTPATDPLASPIHADLTGLAPMFILVGGHEALLSDSIELTRRAALAGVDVRLEVWPEMIHVWPAFAPMLDAGRRAIADAGAWIRTRTA